MKQKSLIEKTLLAFKKVPDKIITVEKVTEKLTGKKMVEKKKTSYKIKSAIKNYQTAVTRKKRADTLLQKHYKILIRIRKKYDV